MAVTAFLSVVVPTTSPFSCRRRSVACTSSTFGLVPSHCFSSCSVTYAFDSRKCRADSPLRGGGSAVVACASSSTSNTARPSTRLFVSGLSFRTTEESLRNAFRNFGELTEVNLVMDRIANRSRGFAFLRFSTEDESKKAIEGMHGKFLDGRVIFVEVAKPKSEMRQNSKPATRSLY